jgi:hypothetical protein
MHQGASAIRTPLVAGGAQSRVLAFMPPRIGWRGFQDLLAVELLKREPEAT